METELFKYQNMTRPYEFDVMSLLTQKGGWTPEEWSQGNGIPDAFE